MADKEDKPATATKPKSHVEAKRAYDALAAQCAELAKQLPKVRAEIERRVKEEFGRVEANLAAIKEKKAAAAREMWAAEAREAPEREAAARAKVEAEAEASNKRKAEENAKRKADNDKAAVQRATEAAK